MPIAAPRSTPHRTGAYAQVLMPLAEPPSPWQRQLGAQIGSALHSALLSPPPADDAEAADDSATIASELTHWRSAGTWRDDIDQWAARLAPTRTQQTLYARCLRHHAHYFGGRCAADDDAGVAVAGLLVACVQALQWHAATPQRWQSLARWLDAHVVLPPFTAGEPLPWRPVCVRASLLTVAIGEWSQQASAQGTLARGSASLMARQHLEGELGLDAELLLRALRHLQLIPSQSLRSDAANAALPN